MEAGGLPPGRPKPSSWGRWSEEACLEALRKLKDELGSLPAYGSYGRLARTRSDLPGPQTGRKSLGSWAEVRARFAEAGG